MYHDRKIETCVFRNSSNKTRNQNETLAWSACWYKGWEDIHGQITISRFSLNTWHYWWPQWNIRISSLFRITTLPEPLGRRSSDALKQIPIVCQEEVNLETNLCSQKSTTWHDYVKVTRWSYYQKRNSTWSIAVIADVSFALLSSRHDRNCGKFTIVETKTTKNLILNAASLSRRSWSCCCLGSDWNAALRQFDSESWTPLVDTIYQMEGVSTI